MTVIKEMTVFVALSGQVPIVIKVHVDYIIIIAACIMVFGTLKLYCSKLNPHVLTFRSCCS